MGVKLSSLPAAAAAAGNLLMQAVSGVSNSIRFDTFADWTIKTYAGFLQSGPGATATDLQTEGRRNFFTPEQFGAKADGSTDDQTAIAACIAAAAAAGRAIKLNGKTYKHSNTLTLNSVQMYGEGDASVLLASDPDNMAIILTGTGPQLRNVKITTTTTIRNVANTAQGVYINAASKFLVEGVHVAAANNGGIANYGGTKGRIVNNFIEGTLADGIYNTLKCANVVISGNICVSTGDDAIAVVGFQADGAQCTDIVINGNTVVGGSSRGVTVLGAQRVSVTGNNVSGLSSTAGFAVYVGYDGTSVTYGCDSIVVEGNTLKQASLSSGNAVVNLVGNGTQTVSNVIVRGNIIDSANAGRGVNIGGAGTPGLLNIAVSANIIKNVQEGVDANFTQDLQICDNTIDTVVTTAIATGTSMSGVARICGNIFKTLNTAAGGTTNAVTINSASSLSNLIFEENFYGGENSIQYFINNASSSTVLYERSNVFSGTTGTAPMIHQSVLKSRSDGVPGVSPDAGDAAATLIWGSSYNTLVFNTALTADRAVTLATADVSGNAKFRIVRTANATGAHNINVGSGPLKALATAGSFCDVEWNVSTVAWMLTAYGTL